MSTDTSTEAALYVAASKVNGETEHEAQANTADGEVPEQCDTASTSASGELSNSSAIIALLTASVYHESRVLSEAKQRAWWL